MQTNELYTGRKRCQIINLHYQQQQPSSAAAVAFERAKRELASGAARAASKGEFE
jgi:hypothetical protein